MPKITQYNEINITPEKYLENCSDDELKEILLLLNCKRYASRIQLDEASEVEHQLIDVAREIKTCRHTE